MKTGVGGANVSDGHLSNVEIKCDLHPLIVIATKGRPEIVKDLVERLSLQTLRPKSIIIVGVSKSDLPDLAEHHFFEALIELVSPQIGASVQRNFGLDRLRFDGLLGRSDNFVVFFDDDFVPANDWLERAAQNFKADADLAGLSGWVLADGVNGQSLDLQQADQYLSGSLAAEPHWSNVARPKPVESLYGCNMAVTSNVASRCRFDENLPLYSWQEDCDYSGQARRIGSTMIMPDCRGVHLGVKSGRTSGVRMGYSQIANPIRIAHRGNMTTIRAFRFVFRAIVANIIKTVRRDSLADYAGRSRGNMIAIADILRLKLDTRRILEL